MVERIEFSGAKVGGRNGAGIRLEGADLTIRDSYFHHNQMGLLTGRNPDSRLQDYVITLFELLNSDRCIKTRPNRSFTLVFICFWPTKISKHTITEKLRYISFITNYCTGHGILVLPHDFP